VHAKLPAPARCNAFRDRADTTRYATRIQLRASMFGTLPGARGHRLRRGETRVSPAMRVMNESEKARGRAFSTSVRLAAWLGLVATAAAAVAATPTAAAAATAATAAITAATAATRPGFARFGLVDRQAPSVDFLIM